MKNMLVGMFGSTQERSGGTFSFPGDLRFGSIKSFEKKITNNNYLKVDDGLKNDKN